MKPSSVVPILPSVEAGRPISDLYNIIPEDHKQPYNARHLLDCLFDGGHLDEFQADYAKEMITGHARVCGVQVGVIANNRGMIRAPGGGPPRFGGIIYTESAEKVAYFIENLQPASDAFALHPGCFRFHGRSGSGALVG